MANVFVQNSTLQAIANAIRSKLGVQDTYKPAEMPAAIESISGGGSATLIEKSISANGTYNASSDSADGYSKVVVSVPASAVDTGTKNITANGTNQDVVGYAKVDVAVPNSYSAGDEGKVVSNGALVAQTSDTVTTNDTYDTTLINSLTVNVSGGTQTLPTCVMGSYYTDSYMVVETLYNHIKLSFTGSRSGQSVNVRRLGTNTNCPEWFAIPSGSTVVITYSNIVNTSNLTWNANLKQASTTTSLDFGIGNGTHLSGETVTITTTSAQSVGCLFLYFASWASGNVFECDITLTIDGVRII